MTIEDRIEFVRNTSDSDLIRYHLPEVFDLYQELFKEVCTGCPKRIPGYITRIKNYKKTKMNKPNFQFRQGVVFPIRGTNEAYSNHNLTDEVAIQILKGNPKRKSLFAKMPDNVDSLIEGKEETVKTKTKPEMVKVGDREFTLEDAVSLLLNIGVTTKAETVNGVQQRFDNLSDDEKRTLEAFLSGNDQDK